MTLPRLPGPLEIARLLHEHAARKHRGLAEVPTPGALLRVQLSAGFVVALDLGPHAPVDSKSQVRYFLRARGQAQFHLGHTLLPRHLVEPFRPDVAIRAHVDAHALPPDRLRERLLGERLTVSFPPHASCLSAEEQLLVEQLFSETAPGTEDTTWEALCAAGVLPPGRLLRLLSYLDALGVLVIGLSAGELAAAFAVLELAHTATLPEIKSAYRRLAKQAHPDQFPQATRAQQLALSDRFSALHEAYRLLLRRFA